MIHELAVRARHLIYAALASGAPAPDAAGLARALAVSPDDARATLATLHDARLVVLDPADPSRVRMALPFSNVRTAFSVEAGTRSWSANCAWDAIAIVRLLGLEDARIVDAGGPARAPRTLAVAGGSLLDRDGLVHFAVPASRWWDDIAFT